MMLPLSWAVAGAKGTASKSARARTPEAIARAKLLREQALDQFISFHFQIVSNFTEDFA